MNVYNFMVGRKVIPTVSMPLLIHFWACVSFIRLYSLQYFLFYFRCVELSLRLTDTLHLRYLSRNSSFCSDSTSWCTEDKNATLSHQVQWPVVSRRVRTQQIWNTGLLQRYGAQDAETHSDGCHGLDCIWTNHQKYRT